MNKNNDDIPTEMMINLIYIAMGIMMVLISKNPLEHKALIDFIILSSLAHAIIMLIFTQNTLQILIDVGFMVLIGIIPLVFYPWGIKSLFS